MTACVGLIQDVHCANQIIEQQQGDLVLMARQFLRDPHFAFQAAKQLAVQQFSWPPQYQRAKQ